MGRPSKLDDLVLIHGEPRKRWEVIVERVRLGSYPEVAAASTGISAGTFYRWKVLGEDRWEDGRKIPARPEYREFREALEKAEAEAEEEAIAHVKRAMSEDWRAAMTYLERRAPQRWRRRETIHEAGPAYDDPVPTRTHRVEVDPDAPGKLAELLELLERAESAETPA